VLFNVAEHVDPRVAYLAGGGQVAGVVAVAPERAAAAEGAVHRPRGADAEPLHTADEEALVVSLGQKVK
jgi:hypothetical protein